MKLRENQIVIDTMLQECNDLVHELRLKLKSKIDEILQLRKDLDLEKEEHQLTQLKYESMRDNLNKVMTKESLNDSLFELNKIILDLRTKLSKSLQEVLQLRKDLDLEKEEHQLTQLKYESMKNNLDKLMTDKLNAARAAVEEVKK